MDSKKLEDSVAPTAEMQLGERRQSSSSSPTPDLADASTDGLAGKFMLGVALGGSLSSSGTRRRCRSRSRFGVFNDTEARSIHLALGLFLAFLAFPAFKSSPRDYVPALDWIFAVPARSPRGICSSSTTSLRCGPASRRTLDVAVGVVGVLLLLEATRRAVGLPMAVLAVMFLIYTMAGPVLPDVIAHKGASISRLISHMWLVTEGVFGIALGVSVSFIFVFVLFGTLLDRAGGGNYMMQVCFALLGPSARRPGQGRGGVVGAERPDLGLVGQQRRVRRHLHDSADEERRLRRRQGGGDRDGIVGRRPDHAAGDGRRGVPDGRVRRHSVFGDHQARVPAGRASATSRCSTSCTWRR